MVIKEQIIELFTKGTYKLDSKEVPLPKNLEIYPTMSDDKKICILLFQVDVDLRGNLNKQFIESLTDMRNYIDMYIEYLKAHKGD